MSDYIEVDGLRVGPNMWRNLKEELTAARDEIETLKSGQVKTDNTQTLVNALAENERLRGRVSELEGARHMRASFFIDPQQLDYIKAHKGNNVKTYISKNDWSGNLIPLFIGDANG